MTDQELEKLNQSLLSAILSKDIEKCKSLLDEGADPNFCNSSHSVLGLAIRLDYFEICKLLIKCGADLSTVIKDCHQAMEIYGSYGKLTCTEDKNYRLLMYFQLKYKIL